jgi:hypothetical protein
MFGKSADALGPLCVCLISQLSNLAAWVVCLPDFRSFHPESKYSLSTLSTILMEAAKRFVAAFCKSSCADRQRFGDFLRGTTFQSNQRVE